MSKILRQSLRRLTRGRRRGQSIPVIALMIVVLIAMVGLSVDVGNTFSQERQSVSASNSAAISGMTTYLQRNANTNISPGDVYDAVQNSLTTNGVTVGDGTDNTVKVNVYYLDTQGKPISQLDPNSTSFPDNVGFLQVQLDGKVNTSFARVVGRNDLPINANAYAGRCPMNSGVYPLAIDATTITNDAFNSTGTTRSAPEYTKDSNNNIQRRIYVKDDSTAGSFSWLRWMEKKGATGKSATSTPELAASLVGEGNIAAGFEEAPWPDHDVPPGYPEQPGALNTGDWVWGSPGWKENNNQADLASVSAALDAHIANRTYLILPIYDEVIGQGSNVQVHVSRLGAFKIVAKGKDAGKGPYFDMVFLGEPIRQETACLVTAVTPNSSKLDLFGKVSLFPEYAIYPTEQKPIQYVVVLDGSGSMSANFKGQCDNKNFNGRTPVQCANGPAGAPAPEVSGTGPSYYWKNQNERRIYVAKKALERLVSLANMPGNTGYTTTRASDQMAVVWFREYVPASQTKGFSNNPASIIDYITHLNNGNGDYRSEGGTNGAAGLYRAKLLYDKAPKTVAFGGKDVEYKRVVLFITDGVSNQFLDTTKENSDLWGGQSTSGTYPGGSYCAGLGAFVIESASCQLTDPVKSPKYSGWDRPISQMIDTSSRYLRNDTTKAEVFVIALSSIASTGLSTGVPSSENYFFSAETLENYADGTTNVDAIIDKINAKVEANGCITGPSGTTTGTITQSEFGTNPSGFAYPQVGEVILSKEGFTKTAPILAKTDGTMSYEFTDLEEGSYTLEAYLYYHHPLDKPSVVRMYSRIWSDGQSLREYTVPVYSSSQNTGLTTQRIDQPLELKLDGNVCPTTN